MRIVVDMQGAQSRFSGHRGVGRYTRGLVQSLLRCPRNHEILLALNAGLATKNADEMAVLREGVFAHGGYGRARYWQQAYECAANDMRNRARGVAAKLTREAFLGSLAPDIIFSTNLQEGFFECAPTSVKLLEKDAPFCSTLHDLTPLRFQQQYLGDPVVRAWYEEKIEFARKSDLIITVSDSSKRDICELLDVPAEKVDVVYNAFDSQIFKQKPLAAGEASAVLARYRIPMGFILYTGGGDYHKNLPRLLEAYAKLPVAVRAQHKLVMVGKRLSDAPSLMLAKKTLSRIADDVIFAGYVCDADLSVLYGLCDVFVFPSLYEGFGLPPLEAMACGAPVIASNTSSLPEVVGLETAMFDPNNTEAIKHKIEQALDDPAFRDELKAHGARRSAQFSWARSADTLLGVFEHHFESRQVPRARDDLRRTIERLSRDSLASQLTDADLSAIAVSLEQTFPPSNRRRRLYVDVSSQIQTSDHTGIQRVTRALAQQLRLRPINGFETVLVYTSPDATAFNVAGSLIDSFDGLGAHTTPNTPVEFYDRDVLLFLDLHPGVAIGWQAAIEQLRNRGVRVYYVVYDIIPYTHPQFFWPQLCEEFNAWLRAIARSDGVFCISRFVAQSMREWLAENDRNNMLHIGWFHLGADLENSVPTGALPAYADRLFKCMRRVPTFLMVGTLEPRKRHAQAVAGFDLLWQRGVDVQLLIVGKEGWGVGPLVKRLRHHPENDKRLFWLSSVSDEFLRALYERSSALIAPSVVEGFGLPLIEAARHKLPLILRDIPVFREVAQDHAYYFSGDEPEDLAGAVQAWLEQEANGKAPSSAGLTWLNWEGSACTLTDQILSQEGHGPLARP